MAGRKPSNLFYRIESERGEGPYRGGSITAFSNRHNYNNRPAPGNDDTIWKHWDRSDSQEYQFGFKTETQMLRWFPRAVIKKMAENAACYKKSYFVSVYRGPCFAGEKQAIAKLNKMELISRTPLAKYAAGEKLIKKGKMEIAPPAAPTKINLFFENDPYPSGWNLLMRRLLSF